MWLKGLILEGEIVRNPSVSLSPTLTEGVSLGRTTPMRSEPNHIRH